jgi:hypothetical protein
LLLLLLYIWNMFFISHPLSLFLLVSSELQTLDLHTHSVWKMRYKRLEYQLWYVRNDDVEDLRQNIFLLHVLL